MKFLITGGAGFLGVNLCRFLADRGHKVRSLDIAPFDYPYKNKYEIIQGDIRDAEIVKKSIRGVDVVVHAAAALPLYKPEEILSVDIGGTKNIIESAHAAGVKRFVHISTTAVYGISDHHPLFETDKLVGIGPYGKAKIEAEKICESFREKGMVVTILRPKSFVGPERLGVFAIYCDWIRRKKNVPIVGNGKNRYQLLDVEDLCEAILLSATKPASAANDTFNIGAKEFTTMKEDFGAVIDFAGTGKKIIPLPDWPAIFALSFLEFFHMSPLYKWVYETAPHDSFVSIEKAEKKLGFRPKFSNKQALIRTYKWYLEHWREYEFATGMSHRVPWKQGILKVVSWFF